MASVKKLSLGLAFALGCYAIVNTNAIASEPTHLINSLSANSDMPSLAPMLKNVIPAVVNISVKGTKEVKPLLNIPEEFRFMFPGQDFGARQQEFRALGSGVIIDAKKGYIVTNYHVVEGADEIRVALSDGRIYDAKKVGEDQHTDLALLELKKFDNLTAINLGNSDDLEVGDFAVAIGNPFGLGQTVTSGIISALGRTGLNIENLENFIQTDAAINSGNSGGALVNLKGNLIGINTAILGPNGGNIGIGFAIPSNMVKTVVDQLIKYGQVKRGSLGIVGTELNADLADSFGYDNNFGAFVNQVIDNSAADKAGIKSGDIIIKLNGKKITSFGELRAKIATLGAGTKVVLTVFRDGKELDLNVTLGKVEELATDDVKEISTLLDGASLANDDTTGVLVTAVKDRSSAYALGLRKGDVILGVNKQQVKNINDLKKQLNANKGKLSALQIKRGDNTLFITIR